MFLVTTQDGEIVVTVSARDSEIAIKSLLHAAKRVADQYGEEDYLGRQCLLFAKDGEFSNY
jgi:hypothetical protein